jgi:hypothetical protein
MMTADVLRGRPPVRFLNCFRKQRRRLPHRRQLVHRPVRLLHAFQIPTRTPFRFAVYLTPMTPWKMLGAIDAALTPTAS